ncbi:single-stranded-DNA-specific exonuclease RecJ [Candidatus Campbellbacteria bacterium RIFCSPLOWO2_02_FULL_35_11]|uniref:Single-stranded-DNA-specific exonuclease RecJ n=2 Tax=Candidatus Campbelliibacteriota TaxID=1752727 RepID=A0A1F5EMJ0_9BACT|nr:MAG: single-stranded-DNA-specific exonuclease RecJ [Candidatus Campbellbacteria bacterium RIFCSPHIGHO2_12_FULL_35_10]OGD70217.1 MAG: single-stranded-DNA-specific exonuclease RecJ [Candidatus Campbellbacteria bacterium RIFCSPLOWO2_02_FULL_35_11]
MQKEEINLKNLDLPEKVKEEFKFYPELLGQLLFSRGIETREEAEKFLRPDYYRDIHDPFLMKDMDKVVDRILRAIRTNEKILIYSDYDADGIPGAVVLYDFFKKINFENFENYIPHRHDEGYGLNIEAVEKFVEQNFNLIITIDCGIKDIKEIELAQKNNIDVIVTDHHIVGEILPPAYAILNPKQNDCNYPDKNLAGAGVVFKLVQALIKKGNFEIREGWEKWLVDMVGLATISDMVSLKGENRVYSYFGLQVLRKSPRHGLVHLLREIKVDQKNLNEDDIAFMITPRINAASRMGEPIRAFELLSARDIETAGSLAKHLDEINKERKTLVSTIVKEANKKLKERNLSDVIVVGSPKWNPGVSGLVASSLVEKHQRTCFVWGRGGDGEIKGSCRSCGIIDVVELMNAVEDGIFVNIGGHKMAGGFSILNDNIHLLEEKLNKAHGVVDKTQEKTEIFVDKKISLDDVNWNTYKIIEQMAPFGVDNQKPTFLIEDVEIFNVKIFGKQNNHLGIDFKNSRGQNISAIKFFADEIENGETAFKRGDKISLIVNLEKSTFRNVNELRLRIVDFVQ